MTGNFEAAIAASNGDLVALSDQDDVWSSHRLEHCLRIFADDGADLVHTDARLIDAKGSDLGQTLFGALEVTASDLDSERAGRAFAVLLRRNLVTGATMMFRRGVYDAARPFPREWVHDEWLAIIAAATGRVIPSGEATIGYRQHGANVIGVRAPDLRYKLSRVVMPRGDRNRRLADQFRVLAERLPQVKGVRRADLDFAVAKAAFERERFSLPASRLRRVPFVVRSAATGRYARFASRGRWDVVRDLAQSA